MKDLIEKVITKNKNVLERLKLYDEGKIDIDTSKLEFELKKICGKES